jgi:hypothetical protein
MKKLLFIAAAVVASYLSQAQWQPDVRLTHNNAYNSICNNNAWAIAASGDTLHVVYTDMGPFWQVHYKRSTNGGKSWGLTDTMLTSGANLPFNAAVSVSGPVVHVVWMAFVDATNSEIFDIHSEDGGSTWGANTRLTYAPLESYCPSLAISGSVLHLVWMDERNDPADLGNYDIFYKQSSDGGLTWGSDTRLTTKFPAAYSGLPCVAVSGSLVHVVWEDNRDGNGEIYYKRSTDGGLSWGADTRLTNDPADSWDPCLALSDSVLHIVWYDYRDGNSEIYYKRSTDGGTTWGNDTRLTNAADTSENPSVAVNGSLVHVVWEDNRDGNSEIYYKVSTDAGLTWGADTRLTNNFAISLNPSVALSDSVVHVVWMDGRYGYPDILYKRNPTGNIPVGIGNELTNDAGNGINIYPNPASNLIHAALDNNSPESKTLSIRNILGEELLSRPVRDGETMIDVTGLQNGVYFVWVTSDNKTGSCKKLIIAK